MRRTAVDDSAASSRRDKPKPAPLPASLRTARRLPRWSELRPLLRPRPLQLDPTQRRLSRALTIADLRTAAKQRTPRAVFDYTDGGAETETSLRRAREAFQRVEFRPRVLRDVTVVDTTTTLLGRPSALPLAFAPTGFTRMMHHQGERAVVRVAEGAGIPYALSTLGTTSIEDVAAAAPTARKWFQLYVWRDRGAGKELVERAQAAGYEALILTVDVPVAGARLRDVRNGLTIPPLADPGDRPGRRHPPGLVAQPAHHRTPGVRLPDLLGGHGRRADQPDVRPQPDGAGPVVAAGELVGAADRQGHPARR